MSKLKTIYICEKCNHEHSKWSGQCLKCGEWNTLIEDVVSKDDQKKMVNVAPITPQIIEAHGKQSERIETGLLEFDRVLGGGIMEDGIVLLSGDPGIGKSTLVLQVASRIAAQGKKVFYFSGEESVEQISGRLHRLGLQAQDLHIIHAVNIEEMVATIQEYKPECIILDSVQVVYSGELPSAAGSITQVRAVAESMMKVAKQMGIPVFMIGHVNKDGNLAGPMVLSHLVDTVLYLEGERYSHFRLLRSLKNRFGSTLEVGVFAMENEGMVEVANPSALFLEGRQANALGSAITVTMEGSRPFMLEVQALTTHTAFGYPKRTAAGSDLNRLQLMIAVLNKYAHMKLDSQDVYLNVVGGFRIKDPAADMSLCMAIASSKLKKSLPNEAVFLGEVGLSGELRTVTHIEKRLKDAAKMGFKQAYVPKMKKGVKVEGLKVVECSTLEQAVKEVLG